MILGSWLAFILATYGLTNIVVNSTLMEPVRSAVSGVSQKLGEHVSCAMCFGTTSGVIVHLLLWNASPFGWTWRSVLLAALAGSAVSWWGHLIEAAIVRGTLD